MLGVTILVTNGSIFGYHDNDEVAKCALEIRREVANSGLVEDVTEGSISSVDGKWVGTHLI